MKTILTIIMMFIMTSFKEEEPIRTHTLQEIVILEPTIQQEIFRTVLECGYDSTMAKLLVAQSRHETGNWKSKLSRKANNVFGMHKAKKNTRAIGVMVAEKGNRFAMYATVEDSTLEALEWLSKKDCPFKFKNSNEYAKWLKSKGYYEDSVANYSNALKAHLKHINFY